MLTYDEHMQRVEKTKNDSLASHRPQLEMLRQASVSAESLTGNPHWDIFLQYLAAAIEDTEGQKKGFSDALADPSVVDTNDIMKAKLSLAECNGRIDAWKFVLSLPKDIIGMGTQAKELLGRMPKEDA